MHFYLCSIYDDVYHSGSMGAFLVDQSLFVPCLLSQVATPVPGKWRVALDSDAFCFGGQGRVGHDVDHFTVPTDGVFHDRCARE